MKLRCLLTLCLLGLVVACEPEPNHLPVTAVLGESASDDGFLHAVRGEAIELPADHGPHNGYRSEWWYLTIALQDANGQDFGVQFTVFRQALQPPSASSSETSCRWCANQAWLGHLALTDVSGGQHWHAERLSRGVDALAGAKAQPFAVWLDDWRLESTTPAFAPLRLRASDTEFAVDVTLRGGSLLLQGDAGYSPKGPGQASHYFSITRLEAEGTVSREGVVTNVKGLAWLDREWSTSVLSSGQQGWDWVSLQLDDGRDVMAFRLRRDDDVSDPFDQAVVRYTDGREQRYTSGEFALRPSRTWSDEHGNDWPTSFELELGDERLLIEAALQDQLMRTLVTYWEGLVIARSADGQRVGAGYLELTGYGDGDVQASSRTGGRH